MKPCDLCAVATAGTYSKGETRDSCTPCPHGKPLSAPGSVDEDDCKAPECDPGFGGPTCQRCPAGTFSTGKIPDTFPSPCLLYSQPITPVPCTSCVDSPCCQGALLCLCLWYLQVGHLPSVRRVPPTRPLLRAPLTQATAPARLAMVRNPTQRISASFARQALTGPGPPEQLQLWAMALKPKSCNHAWPARPSTPTAHLSLLGLAQTQNLTVYACQGELGMSSTSQAYMLLCCWVVQDLATASSTHCYE